MIKAAHFLQAEKTGILVIVMTPKRNSSLDSYPKHIEKYFNWIKDKTNLKEIYFIDESNYSNSKGVQEIGSKIFKSQCLNI